MKAELNTRCGCKKELDTTYPAPPTIVVPLKAIISFSSRSDAKPEATLETRTFKLKEFYNQGPYASFATYEEVR